VTENSLHADGTSDSDEVTRLANDSKLPAASKAVRPPENERQIRECPIGPEEAAAFLKIARSTVMALARAGKIPSHPVTNSRRKRWLFFISELDAYVRGLGVNCGSHPCA
jgi:excisionase family DNA binding protein